MSPSRTSRTSRNGRTLVLAGGGHAHLEVLARLPAILARGHRVILVSLSPYHYYSGMGPGLLGGFYQPHQLRFPVAQWARAAGARFVLGRAVRIEPEARQLVLEGGIRLAYDVLSLNLGSGVAAPGPIPAEADAVPVKPIANLVAARQRLLARLAAPEASLPGGAVRVLVLGGGAAGCEVAGNLLRLAAHAQGRMELTVIAGSKLFAGDPEKVGELARASLERRGATILEGVRARRIGARDIELDDGRRLDFAMCFLATGTRPGSLAADSGLRTGPEPHNGGLAVAADLANPTYREIFGAGDCIHFLPSPLAKVGVYAVRQAPVLASNLLAALEEVHRKPFDPGNPEYMLLYNMGDGRAILRKGSFVAASRVFWWLKDAIDRRFVRKYQREAKRAIAKVSLAGR